MKNHFYRILSCALLLLASTTSVLAENGIRETLYYTICPGETIRLESERVVVITKSTILYDTMHVTNPNEDSITAYVVTLYPSFEKDEYKRLQKGESYTWQDTTISDPGVYERIYHSQHECDSIYRLHVTQQIDSAITFTLCDDESVSFNGRTYSNAGVYTDILSGDTVYTITIVKHPSREFVQYGVLDRTHPYYWQYTLDGEQKTDTIYEPGRYVYTSQNPETGCNDRWILILTKDETTFHSIETVTICESEDFSWRNHQGLNKLGVGQTIHYYDRYRTEADQDSIYELILTVKPTLRSTRTIPFCGSIEWNGKMYTESTTIVDSLKSVQFSCDSIVTTILVKGTPVTHRDTISILGGETLMWHGRPITQAGDYTDIHNSVYGCDTTFYLHVDVKEPAHVMNTHSEWYSICQGDGQLWRGNTYYNSGIYYDTIKTANEEIDSLYILYLTVNPTYAWSERISFLSFPTTYRDSLINQPGAYVFKYQSTFGCDSIITSYIDQDVYRDEQTVTICPGETHIWSYDGQTYTVSGKYTKVEQNAAGHDSVIHVLNLTVRYIPETHIEHTMCKGETYIFADQSLTQSGVYRHTYHKTGGCDSVVVLSLNVLSPDTTYLAIQRPQGESYVWDGETIRQPGMYFHYGTNRFGCDSVSILQFTYNQVDTVSATLTVCPNELPFEWNGISANQTNRYTRLVQEANGNYTYYVLDLTVREVAQRDTTLSICEGGSITFNGVTYDEAGHYRTYLTCDTLINVHIIVNQPVVYETHGTITDDHGFTWQYIDHGTPGEQEFKVAGTYEYENPNPTTGCNDIYRLILTKDETSYHFEESLTICEGDDFTWHGLANLSSITGTNTYTDKYETRAGKDSIYTLHLTVIPVERTVRTIVFCGETSWNGKTYTESTVVYDTISLPTGCYRIERINLDKEATFYQKEYKELPQGTVLHWHGQNITTDGTYYDYGMTVNGCDSTYEITVKIIPATPQTNQYAEELSTCEGDTIVWRGKDIWRSGVYVDTVYAAGTNNIDSIFSLTFTAWPAPKDTIIQHLYTCSDGAAIRYNGQDYYTDQVVVTNFKTIHNCDSIVKVFLHFNTALSLSRTDTITDLQLPHTWTYQLYDHTRRDTVLTKSGTYTHTVASEGGCTNQETLTLVVLKTYLFELDTTICETDLPLLWRGQYLQHTIGQTKQYEDVLKTVHNTDSIYRINLTIDPAPKRVERIAICENKDTIINGKSYFDPVLYPVGQVFRDTMYKHNGDNECDSIIYYEITKTPQRHITETRILHVGESFEWHEMTISDPVTKTYTLEDEIDPNTGCEIIYQIRVIAEQRTIDTICILDTPYVWNWNNEKYYISGLFTDTVYESDGKIGEYHTLQLAVTDVPHTTVQLYLCDGDQETLPNGKTYHNLVPDSIYRDTITIMSPKAGCDSTIYYEILQRPIRTTIKNEILRQGDTIFWMGDTITRPVTMTYTKDSIDEVTGCKIVNQLRVVAEHRDIATICVLDTPYVWEHRSGLGGLVKDSLYTTGLYTDTVRDAENFITDYLTMDLTVKIPVDTFRVLRGCKPNGVTWNGINYTKDTIFRDTLLTCDTLYTIKIQLDTNYNILRFDTICEHELPYVVGQGNKLDSVYREGWQPPFTYKTACGCDSIVQVHLTIIPDFDMDHSDSIFVCEESMPMYIGDTVTPAFDPYRQKVDEWKDKWIGVQISKDTIIYNCGKVDSLHIIMRPHQAHIPEYEYSLCKGDSVQLFWPHKDTWIKEPGNYEDTVPTISSWVDLTHNTLIHNDRAFACDSIVRWKVRYTDTLHVHQYAHIRQGDTYRFNDSILTTTGVYDSIGYYIDIVDPLDPNATPVTSMDSSHHYCKAIYTLHLTVDPVYRYGDTIEICYPANREYTYTFDDDLEEHFEFKFQAPEKDTAILHFKDSTMHLSYEFYDHFYDLVVYYKQRYEKIIKDTICYGDSIQFDQHYFENENNVTVERYLKDAGNYTDTLVALNGCDSIIHLYLHVLDRIIIEPQSKTVTDRELPYKWINTWREPGATQDSIHIDELYVSGDYTYTMPNKNGCDSTVVLNFTVHQTHVFRDTLDICAPINKTFTHEWATEYKQKYTTPLWDDTLHYYDTLVTFYPLDSIYDLYVNFHRTYETHVYDTICAGDSAQIDTYNLHTLPKHFYKQTGIYRDTIESIYGCDSVVVLHLQVWPGFPTTHKRADIADIDTPYLWEHTWMENGLLHRDTDSLSISGEYSVRLPNIHGCDSIDSLSLVIHQTYNIMLDTITICHDEVPYTWEDKNEIRTSGFYAFKTQTHDGYDSIRTVYIEILPIMHTVLNTSICEGDSMRFGLKKDGSPLFLYKDSVYFDTLTSVLHGCDSIIEMRLNVFPREMNKYDRHIADVDTPFIWEHKQSGVIISRDSLYIAGKYEYIFQSQLGCDSIDSLTLYIHKTYRIQDDTINICEHDVPFQWRGLDNITSTGDYEYGEQTIEGYDSIHYVHINIWKQTYDTVYATICEGDSMRWGMDKMTLQPRFVHTAGLHNDTTINAHGCDQVNVLNLTVHPRYYNEQTVHIADVDTPYVWKHFNQAGDSIGVDSLYATDKYGFRFETTFACDSIDSLNLFVHNTYKFTEEFTICERQTPYTWQNRNDITESGTYYYNPRTKDGYDSIYIATITVMPTVREIITEKICKNNLPFDFHGTDLWTGGIYIDTLASVQSGCDSIVELHLTVNDPYYHFERHDIYEGNSYDFFGESCTTSGTYTHKTTTPAGCDSITELMLVVHPLIDTVANVCAYDLPFVWVNHWNGDTTLLHAAGLYHNDTTYVNGERTFWSIQLNVIEPVHDTIHAAICEGTSYPFIGMDLTEPGTYRDTTQGSNGCDSITTLILTVNRAYYSVIRETILEGNSYIFYGDTLINTGTYTHYARTPEGCDSTTVLQLSVHPMVDTIITVCDNDLPVIWTNRWNGQQELFYSEGLYRNDTTINSEKRFYGIQVNVNKQVFDTIRHAMCEGSSYEFKGNTYYEAGIYRDTLRAANGCDSIVTLILTVNKPYYNIIRETILEGQYYVFFGDTLNNTGTYTHYARTPEGCDSTTVLQLSVHPMVDTIITVCDNDLPVIWTNRWNGQQELFYSEGLYRNDTTINGEKRFYGIQVNILNQVFDTIRHAMCEGSSYEFKGNTYYEQGIYRDTLSAANGCDSIVTLILTVNKPYYSIIRETILEGQYYVFFGDTIRETKTVSHSGRTPEGCDSTTVLELTVHQLVDTVVTVCSSELPYIWHNRWSGLEEKFYAAGTYRNDTTIDRERMYYGVKLIVTEPTSTTIYREICEGDKYNFNNRLLEYAGEYRDTIRNTSGCDSIIILHLNVLRKYYHTVTYSIYEGDSVFFQGQYFKESGAYPFRFTSSFGCDSVVELKLTVNRLYDDSVSVCANDLPLKWRGQTIYESGIYRDTVSSTNGTSVVGIKVTVLPIAHLEEPIMKTICEGDFYKFGDSILTTQGTYYDTLTAANGCDSIVTLVLKVQPTEYKSEVRRIFEGDSALFNGVWYKESGVYEYREINEHGCTDTYQLILTVLKTFNVDTTAYVCSGELPYTWRGIEYNETGDYAMPIAWTDSSRVVKTLHLTVRDSYYSEEHISVCYGNIFVINNKIVSDTTEVYDTIPARNGCDSIIHYIISVYPKYEKWDTVHISDKQTYPFDGRDLSVPGDYERTTLTNNGCDSIIHLHLEVHPSYFFKDSVDICQPDSYIWRNHGNKIGSVDPTTGLHEDQDMIITESGIYYDRKLTRYGFDSIYEIKVTVHPSYEFHEQYEIGEGEQLKIHGMDITTPGTYTDHLLSKFGCDSIYQIVVNPKRTREFMWVKTICQGDYIEFPDGTKNTKTGNYIYYSANRDTIIYLSLTVIEVNYTEERIVIPDKYLTEPYLHTDGKLYTITHLGSNVFEEKIASGTKCDNIHRLILYVTNKVSEVDEIPLCEGESITVNGKLITAPGLYPLEVRSKSSLETDSLHYVEVYLSHKYDFPMEYATICDNDSIVYSDSYGTKVYKVSGVYEIKLKSQDGCDSIHHLTLTVNPTFFKEESARVLDDELPYVWEGEEFTMSGDYYHRTQVNECDDTHILHLTVVETQYIEAFDTICNTDTLYWRGKAYHESGTYYDTYRDAVNKHKIIYTLNLEVVSPTNIVSARVDGICADDDSFDIAFNYSGHRPTTYSIYFEVAAKQAGFTDLINQPLTEPKVAHVPMPVFSELAYENHPYYVKPNTYSFRLVLDNGVCGLSKSEELKLDVKYPNWIIEQNWNDIVVPIKKELNGGYEFSQADWIVNGVRQLNNGRGYLQYNFRDGDEVVMIATRKGENYAIETCPLVISLNPTLSYDDPILIYPTQAPKQMPRIHIEAPKDGTYEVYGSTGTLLFSGNFTEGETEVTLPAINGIYFIRTMAQGAEPETHKVIIY